MIARLFVLTVILTYIAFTLYLNRSQFWRLFHIGTSLLWLALGIDGYLKDIDGGRPASAYVGLSLVLLFCILQINCARLNLSLFDLIWKKRNSAPIALSSMD